MKAGGEYSIWNIPGIGEAGIGLRFPGGDVATASNRDASDMPAFDLAGGGVLDRTLLPTLGEGMAVWLSDREL